MEMSENIYANTTITLDNRSDSEDSDNSYEDIYTNNEILETQKEESLKEPNNPVSVIKTVESRYYRTAALCLGLLCVLLSAAIIVLSVKLTAERDQLQTSYNNMTAERDQLQTSYNNMTAERDQLQTSYNNMTAERDQLQTSYNNMTAERDQLQTSYNNMTAERDQFQTSYNSMTAERDQLQTSYNLLTTEKEQIERQVKQVTGEKDNLQTSHNDMRNQRDQLQQLYAKCGCFRIGDRVRVKASIQTPKYQWGDASHKSVGVITTLKGDDMVVNFPEHSGWKGRNSEMELVTGCN
ncbi:E3 ubiquitin-protein ligase KEG-like [Astyanax mexicanus]|uniref:E3 ubiquitin-protein ligase KEG-like n=1 Tax=Astyanax mexicanus TaxID=7994 RepID=A0A8T2LF74_ASTMX|nr:E3 ubiquitin-protein ligase KEG-like [Astyanax mexicanus]